MNLLSYFPMLLGDGITTLHKFNLLLMKNQDYLSFKNVFFPLHCCPMNKFFSTICLDYIYTCIQFSSVAQSCLTLRPHESQHARPPCPSPTPGVH